MSEKNSNHIHVGANDLEKRYKLLLIEDNEDVRSACEAMLRASGYDVISAASVTEVRNHADLTELDLILSDYRLADGTGPGAVAVLREHLPDVPVIYMSGYLGPSMPADIESSASFLQKPFRAASLKKAIAEALSSS